MNRHLSAWLAWASLVLSGCAGCPPMKAGWYLVDRGAGQAPELYIALVNEGGSTTLRTVTVNPTKDDGSGSWHFKAEGKEMKPGQIVLLKATEEGSPNCMVPVRIALQCANAPGPSWISVTGSLPNYVPQRWIDSPQCMNLTGNSS